MGNAVNNGNNSNGHAISRVNKAKVLQTIRKAKIISRTDIVHETGISAPTVTRIVDELICKQKIVKQIGTVETSRGRPPKMIQFDGEKRYVIGIDWGRTHIYAGMADLNGNIINEIDMPSMARQDFDKDLASVFSAIEYLIRQSEIEKNKLLGIGLAAAGFIDKEGIIEYSPNFKWKNANAVDPIREKFNIPVIINKGVHARAIGELYYGSHGLDDFIYIYIGYGIGSGIITNGNLLMGYDGYAGEIGHTQVIPTAYIKRKCACGKYNCLECFSSGWGIEYIAKEKIKNNPDSVVNLLTNFNHELIDVKVLANAARIGDAFARKIFEEAAEVLGIKIANMANMFNPRAIILGGKVINAGGFFIDKIYESFRREQLPYTARKIKMLKTSIPEKGAVKGAIGLILREVLNFRMFDNSLTN